VYGIRVRRVSTGSRWFIVSRHRRHMPPPCKPHSISPTGGRSTLFHVTAVVHSHNTNIDINNPSSSLFAISPISTLRSPLHSVSQQSTLHYTTGPQSQCAPPPPPSHPAYSLRASRLVHLFEAKYFPSLPTPILTPPFKASAPRPPPSITHQTLSSTCHHPPLPTWPRQCTPPTTRLTPSAQRTPT